MNVAGYSLIITNEDGKEIDLYDDPEIALMSSSGFGLNADINTSTDYAIDGSVYNFSTIPERILGFVIQYQNIPDAEAAKIRLHNVFAAKQKLKIHYKSPHRDCYIYGYCEKCETPENAYPMETTISVICSDPYWNVTDGEITVPFNGDTLTIEYDGDSPIGFIVRVNIQSTTKVISLSNNGVSITSNNEISGGHGWIDTITEYEPGTELVFDTRTGEKTIKYYRGGDHGIDRWTTIRVGDLFPLLTPGTNNLHLSSDGSFTATCTYEQKSGGI